MKILLMVAAVAAVFALPASAAKPFVGSLSVEPNPVAVGGSITVQGCGFPDEVTVGVATPAYQGTTAVATSGGCFELAWVADSGAGTYVFSVYERHDHGASIRLELLNRASTQAQ